MDARISVRVFRNSLQSIREAAARLLLGEITIFKVCREVSTGVGSSGQLGKLVVGLLRRPPGIPVQIPEVVL